MDINPLGSFYPLFVGKGPLWKSEIFITDNQLFAWAAKCQASTKETKKQTQMQTWIEKTGALMKADQNKLLPKKESRKEQRLWSRLLGQIMSKQTNWQLSQEETRLHAHTELIGHMWNQGGKVKPEEEAQNELCLCGSR